MDESEMRKLLCDAYARDSESSFLEYLGRKASDPAMPLDANNNRRRIHPLWLTLGFGAAFMAGVFLYFSFAR